MLGGGGFPAPLCPISTRFFNPGIFCRMLIWAGGQKTGEKKTHKFCWLHFGYFSGDPNGVGAKWQKNLMRGAGKFFAKGGPVFTKGFVRREKKNRDFCILRKKKGFWAYPPMTSPGGKTNFFA